MLKICEENRIGNNINFDKLIVNVATNITDIDSMFWEDNDYDRISLNDLFFENLNSAIGAFENCERVGIIDIIGKAEKTLDISNMFFNCFCLYKLFFLIDCDEYIMNDSFANCVQLDHIVCYENFKNQYLKNEHLNCPKLNEMNYDLYAMTIDKYKFIESLLNNNFTVDSIDELDGVLSIKKFVIYIIKKVKK